MSVRCPNCKGTQFSVDIEATQKYDGEYDTWGDIDAGEDCGGHPYCCTECGNDYGYDELEEYTPGEDTQTRLE